jgi:histidinol-phosphate aminotransferase
MSNYWNKRTANLSPYVPGEQPKDRKFIKLNTNENPYPPSPKVIEAIEQALAVATQHKDCPAKGEKLRLYPDPLCTSFREAVAASYGVKPAQVFPGNGSDEVLAFAFGAFFETAADCGESVNTNINISVNTHDYAHSILFPDITYSFYPVYANLWNVPYMAIPVAEDFSVKLDDYPDVNGGVIIPNPNAPTGRALSAPDLLSLAVRLEQNNRMLIVDEAYAAFGAESLVPHIADHPNLLTVHTLSKSASLAGLRVGFAIGSEELIDGLFRVRDSFNSYTMDALSLAGGSAAVLDKAYYDTVNRNVIATRDRTAAALSAMGFTVIPSKANFLFITPPNRSGIELFQALRERGILVRHFNKPRIADYLRVSIGTGEDMDVFLSACKEITNM